MEENIAMLIIGFITGALSGVAITAFLVGMFFRSLSKMLGKGKGGFSSSI